MIFPTYLFFTVTGIAVVALLTAIIGAFQSRKNQQAHEQTAMALRHRDADLGETRRKFRQAEAHIGTLEEESRRVRIRHNVLFNHARDMLFIHGVTEEGLPGRLLEVNDVACALLAIPGMLLLLRLAPWNTTNQELDEGWGKQ